MDTSKFEYLTIEPANPPCSPNEVAVKGYRKCKKGVMKGQMLAHFIATFPNPESAAEAYPEADPGNQYTTPEPSYNHLPDDEEPPVNSKMKPNGRYQ